MHETIRQYIRRRVWWCSAIAVGGWLLFPLATAIGNYLPEAFPRAAIPVAGIVLFAGAILAMQRIVKCAKCKARLAQTIAMPVAFSWGSGPKINFCPYCGIHLDEPVPGREAVAPSQNPIQPG